MAAGQEWPGGWEGKLYKMSKKNYNFRNIMCKNNNYIVVQYAVNVDVCKTGLARPFINIL